MSIVFAVGGLGWGLACGEGAPPPKVAAPVVSEAPPPRSPAPVEPPGAQAHATGPTYDDALAEPEDVMALQGERELTNAELSAPLRDSRFLSACGVPDATAVTVKIAIRDGAVIGASVYLRPDDAQLAECVDRAVRALTWPASKHRDSLVMTY